MYCADPELLAHQQEQQNNYQCQQLMAQFMSAFYNSFQPIPESQISINTQPKPWVSTQLYQTSQANSVQIPPQDSLNDQERNSFSQGDICSTLMSIYSQYDQPKELIVHHYTQVMGIPKRRLHDALLILKGLGFVTKISSAKYMVDPLFKISSQIQALEVKNCISNLIMYRKKRNKLGSNQPMNLQQITLSQSQQSNPSYQWAY
ncbi:hypothetical protein FGO68_gene12110 [Halteria grandinella]|uniref:Uncharacterized protein n=1 Tax=Halteria grandinella TaxID=5974 RepID=A0A8J8SW56_HALGN|nr:hypothetical protein FGO68_gene12110 [Halteria grandinella]